MAVKDEEKKVLSASYEHLKKDSGGVHSIDEDAPKDKVCPHTQGRSFIVQSCALTCVVPRKSNSYVMKQFKLAYWILLLIGVGFLLPYSAFITAVDYFTFLYPTRKVEYTFPAVYMVSVFIAMMLLVKYHSNTTNNTQLHV